MIATALVAGCESKRPQELRKIQQELNEAKTKSDDLRNAVRYLAQMRPLNRTAISKEVQLYLNKWLLSAPKFEGNPVPQEMVDGLPPDLRSETGLSALDSNAFTTDDVEYLFQCRMFKQLSDWIIAAPLRDSLLRPGVEQLAKSMDAEEATQLEQACKLFDWTVRNVPLQGEASDVERLQDDARKPISDQAIGYGYLPWESILFSRGDFIERGRVFVALAKQRGLATTWISLRLPTSPVPKVWAVGVLIGDKTFVFEPKLSLPILNPDTLLLATLKEIQQDQRILRRCDVPGRFDYAVNPGDAANVEFLLDVEAAELPNRMKQLQAALLADERMNLTTDVAELSKKLKAQFPQAPIALWQTPLLARVYSANVRERLRMNSPFTNQYMIEHASWFMETPTSAARLKHLRGEFEDTFDAEGALATYMSSRLPDEQLARLPDDPDVQRELGIPRIPNEELPMFQERMRRIQFAFGRSKLDANFLLGQLQFDRGNYESAAGWMKKRTLGDARASMWFPAAWYTLARTYQEEGKTEEAIAAYSETPSPMEPGNRLRIRYLTK